MTLSQRFRLLAGGLGMAAMILLSPGSSSAFGPACGTSCFAQMRGFCPTCGYGMGMPAVMPWGIPAPYYWNTAPMMFANFYSPAPWNYVPAPVGGYPPGGYPMPGVVPGYFPGNGMVFAAKPNLYVYGPEGAAVSVKIRFVEEGTNWLASVPSHADGGWKATLAKNGRIAVGDANYSFLYSDYRFAGATLQDEAGFCAPRDQVLSRMALEMKSTGFKEREIGHFLEYWTVKMPQSESYCVYPQDDRQLGRAAALDITPKPAEVRRLLFLVQVKEGIRQSGGRFTRAPVKAWSGENGRSLASVDAKDPKAITVHEWGVAFLAASP